MFTEGIYQVTVEKVKCPIIRESIVIVTEPKKEKEPLRHTSELPHIEDQQRRDLATIIGCALETLFGKNNNVKLPDLPNITMFHSNRVPPMPIKTYYIRVAKYSECSIEARLMSVLLLNKLVDTKPFIIDCLNIHRLILTSLLISAKFIDDRYYNNAFYAKIGGIAKDELNMLEVELLTLLNFDLIIDPKKSVDFMEEINHPTLHTSTTDGECKCLLNTLNGAKLFYESSRDCSGSPVSVDSSSQFGTPRSSRSSTPTEHRPLTPVDHLMVMQQTECRSRDSTPPQITNNRRISTTLPRIS